MKLLTKLLISLLIGGFFLYLTIKDIQLTQLNFQFSENSIDKNLSFVFANTYYVLGVGTTILLGMVFLPFTKFTFQDIWTAITKTSTEQK